MEEMSCGDAGGDLQSGLGVSEDMREPGVSGPFGGFSKWFSGLIVMDPTEEIRAEAAAAKMRLLSVEEAKSREHEWLR